MSTKHALVDLHLEGGRGLGFGFRFGFRTEAMNRGGQRLFLDLWSSLVGPVIVHWEAEVPLSTIESQIWRAGPEVSKSPLFYTED